jgi:hypothetical protein
MLKVTVRNNVKFPNTLIDQEDLEKIAQDIIIKDLGDHIDMRASIDQGALPFNEKETIKKKGHGHQLIDTGELRRSFYYKTKGKNAVIITILEGRKEIGGYLQDGIMAKGSLKKYIFFGVSDFAMEKSVTYMRDKLEKKLNGNRQR